MKIMYITKVNNCNVMAINKRFIARCDMLY